MASITFWSQLLPSPRTSSVAASLAARVRDPAWFLARQWQLGEFEGADAGSPAFVQIGSHTASITSAQLGASSAPLMTPATTPPSTQLPLLHEPIVESEGFTPDLATRVEIGQSFEALLTHAGVASSVRDQFRSAYPIAAADASADAPTAAFLRLCAGRAVDGAALYAAAKSAPSHVPAKPAIDAGARASVEKALNDFVAWVESTWGSIGASDAPTWHPERLEYGVTVSAPSPSGGSLTLSGQPDSLADLDWYSLDLASTPPPAGPGAASTRAAPVTVIPGHVRFRGMPNARWWDFEGSKTDFGAITPDSRDLAKLLFMDFMLLHGDDWFLAPLAVQAGSLCWIDSLTVTDVFGTTAQVPRANGAGWSMFDTTDTTGNDAGFLVVPSTASAALIAGAPIEEVHLLRDETADMAWAVEHIVEGALGQAQPEPLPPAAVVPSGAPAALAYQLSTPLPSSWFPLMPQASTNSNQSVTLQVGTVEGGGKPLGRIVRGLTGLQLPDAEVPRSGVRVQRVTCRARSADGQMHLWIARRTRFGAGAASSGLRYDVAQSTSQ